MNDDRDGDGKIAFSEFMVATHLSVGILKEPESFCQGSYFKGSGSVRDKLKWQFMLYDRDNSGSITKEEMMNMFLMMCQQPIAEETDPIERKLEAKEIGRKAEELFRDLDVDGDEKVTLEEFIKGFMTNEELMKQISSQ